MDSLRRQNAGRLTQHGHEQCCLAELVAGISRADDSPPMGKSGLQIPLAGRQVKWRVSGPVVTAAAAVG